MLLPLTTMVSTRQTSPDVLSIINPSFSFQGTHQERQAFDVFRNRVTAQLSGHFDGWFWKRAVLQASHQEPIIKHATLALSGLAQSVQTKDPTRFLSQPDAFEGSFALQHYNRAIKELRSSAQRGHLRLDVCLITCLLFAAFEVTHRQ